MLLLFFGVCVGIAAALPLPPAQPGRGPMRIGTELGRHDAADTLWPFIDLGMRATGFHIRAWRNERWTYWSDTGTVWRSDGYPEELQVLDYDMPLAAVGVLFEEPSRKALFSAPDCPLDGDETRVFVSWEGSGRVSLEGMAMGNGTEGSFWADVATNASLPRELRVVIWETDPDDPVHALSVIPGSLKEEYDAGTVFRPEVTSLLSQFSLLRFADWFGHYVHVHGHALLRAESFDVDRSLVSDFGQGDASRGVALEYVLELCLETESSCWLHAPEDASDAYLHDMAQMVSEEFLQKEATKQNLVYIEYGRELGYTTGQKNGLVQLLTVWEDYFADRAEERERVRLVLAVTNPYYLPHIIDIHGRDTLARVDTFAFKATTGASLGWDANGFDSTATTNWTFTEALDRIRESVLFDEIVFNRRVHAIHEVNVSRAGPPIRPLPPAPGFDKKKSHEIVAYGVGQRVSAPRYGKRWEVEELEKEGKGVGVELMRKAQAEQKFQDFLLQLNAAEYNSSDLEAPVIGSEGILLDFLHRLERCGYSAAITMTPSRLAARKESAQLGYLGAVSLDGGVGWGWNGVERNASHFLTSQPQMRAIQRYVQDHNSTLLPFSAATRTLSDGGLKEAEENLCGCEWGVCVERKCHCYFGVEGDTCSNLTFDVGMRPAEVGVNVAGIADWSTQLTYVDAARSARHWISQCGTYHCPAWEEHHRSVYTSDEGEVLWLDVAQSAGTMLLRDHQGTYFGGKYVVLWEGDGVVQLSMDDVVELQRTPGRILIELTPTTGLNNGLFIRIERQNRLDPVRNIRVVPVAQEHTYAASPFHPAFLQRLHPFASTIRAMDLLATNHNYQQRWSERVTRRNRTYSIEGVPLEDVVLLGNTLAANLWLNVPHLADDDYVEQMAVLVRNQLRPDLNVTVELSNEVWGTLFPGGQYAREEGVRRNLDTLSTLSSGPGEAALCWIGVRTREIAQVWERVWGVEEREARLTFVVSAQSANPDTSRRILACNETWRYVDALGIAPYFNAPLRDSSSALVSLDTLLNDTLPTAIEAGANMTIEHAALSSQYNLSLLLYEAGQHLVATGDDDATDRAIAANHHPQMRQLYRQYLRRQVVDGPATSAMMFSFVGTDSGYGSWGMYTSLRQPQSEAPKALGILDIISELGGGVEVDTGDLLVCPEASPNAAIPTIVVREQGAESWRSQGEVAGLLANARTGLNATACSDAGMCAASVYGGDAGSCFCELGSNGVDCGERDFVDHSICSYQCSGHGTCDLARIEQGFHRYYECFCDDGYAGDRCTVYQCKDHCNWNGKCQGDLTCACFDGFEGESCEVNCGCGGHGKCVSQLPSSSPSLSLSPGQQCICDKGYRWDRVLQTCAPLCACTNGLKCKRPGVCALPGSYCVHGSEVDGRCECYRSWTGPRCNSRLVPGRSLALADSASFSPIAMNPAGIADWSTELVFSDLFKTARGWISQWQDDWRPGNEYRWDIRTPQNLSQDGWPRSIPERESLGTLLARDVGRKGIPDGVYNLLYDGDGDVQLGMDAEILEERKGWIRFRVRLSTVRDNGIYIKVNAINASNPLRNIRVALPGQLSRVLDGAIFHPAYVASMSRYSALRFMDLQHTNDARYQRKWIDRPTPSRASFGSGWVGKSVGGDAGVPLEHLIDLANIVQADAWFCIPNGADNTYIRNFATMIRDRLDPSLKVYVAKGNERWNPLFSHAYNFDVEQAAARNLSNNHVFHGVRSEEIFDIFTSVFGEKRRREQLVLVVDTQTSVPWITSQIFSASPTLAKKTDALGVTAYISCGGLGSRELAQSTGLLSVDEILDACVDAVDGIDALWRSQVAMLREIIPEQDWKRGQQFNASAAASKSLFSSSPIPLVVYEGGPALVEQATIETGSETPGLADKLIAASRHPRMESVYLKYLKSFGRLGLIGGRHFALPFFHFSSTGRPSRYGSWGLLEYTGQPRSESPKARALDTFASSILRQLLAPGCTNPNAINYDPNAVTSNSSCIFPPTRITATSGGIVRIAGEDGSVAKVKLLFPPRALDTDVDISVNEVGDLVVARDDREVVGQAFEFLPSGLEFATPVNACITINMTLVEQYGWNYAYGSDDSSNTTTSSYLLDEDMEMAFYYSGDEGETWEVAEESYWDESTGTLCGLVRHFSLAAAFRVNATTLSEEVEQKQQEVDAQQSGGSGGGGGDEGGGGEEGGVLGMSLEMMLGIIVGVIVVGVIVSAYMYVRRGKKGVEKGGRKTRVNPAKANMYKGHMEEA